MYFFTELTHLNHQSIMGNIYGPVVTDDTNNTYEISSVFRLVSDSKAFACQDAQMLVLPYVDVTTGIKNTDLVNIVLKPIQGLEIPFSRVQYYVYRGILKNSLFDASGAIVNNPATNSDLLKQIWEQVDKTNEGRAPENLLVPEPQQLFAFDENLPANTLLSGIFLGNQVGLSTINVKEGDWIANFTSAEKINFEIIINPEHEVLQAFHSDYLRFDVAYFQKSKHTVDVSNVDSDLGVLTASKEAFKRKVRREEILSFIDPAAFFGMHHNVGLSIASYASGSKTTETKIGQALYDEVLVYFATKDRIYLDIRNENGLSCNFYENYQLNAGGAVIQIKKESDPGFTDHNYTQNSWPICFLDSMSAVTDTAKLELKLRYGPENGKPVVYLENKDFYNSTKVQNFVDLVNNTDPLEIDWGDALKLKIPAITSGASKTCFANYIRLHYLRNENYRGAFPTKVPDYIQAADTAFASVKIAVQQTLESKFKQVQSHKLRFVRGSDFSYVSYPEIFKDGSLIVYIAENQLSYKQSKALRVKTTMKGLPILDSPLFPKDLLFQRTIIIENTGTEAAPVPTNVGIIDVAQYKNRWLLQTRTEDLFFLGLTQEQQENLQNTARDLSSFHPQHLLFEPTGAQLKDLQGIPFRKFNLKLLGVDDEGRVTMLSPNPTIVVYSFNNTIYSSTDFVSVSRVENELTIPDPTTFKEWEHYGKYKVNEDELIMMPRELSESAYDYAIKLKGNIFFPSEVAGAKTFASLPSTQPKYPLIMMIHGAMQYYQDYDALMIHLARNGFIAFSLSMLNYSNFSLITEFTEAEKAKYSPYTSGFFAYQNKYAIKHVNGEIVIGLYDGRTVAGVQKDEYIITDKVPGSDVSADIHQFKNYVNGVDYRIVSSAGKTYFERELPRRESHSFNPDQRAQAALLYLSFLNDLIPGKIEPKIGVIGHSRGGQAAAWMDSLISRFPVNDFSIGAAFSLAPVDDKLIDLSENPINKEKKIPTKVSDNVPLFLLYGSKDGDVKNEGPGIWDRALSAWKAMAFVHGATHKGFINNNSDYNDVGEKIIDLKTGDVIVSPKYKGQPLTKDDFLAPVALQQTITKAFTNAFFRKTLKGETFWKTLFTGDEILMSMQHPIAKINYQYREKPAFDIENFNLKPDDKIVDDDAKLIAILGDTSVQQIINGSPTFRVMDLYSIHDTKALYVDLEILSTLTPSVLEFNLGSEIDISAFAYLSFRITKKYGVATDLSGLTVLLYDGRTHSEAAVKTPIPEPYRRYDNENYSKSFMITVRVPLSDFTGIDLTRVTKLAFNPKTDKGVMELDDIEFTN